jgi:hypothetical protein
MSDPVSYTAVLPVTEETVLFVSGLLSSEQRRRRTRRRRRTLGCYRQAAFVLRWFVDGTRLAQPAADNRPGSSTAYRYLHEGIDVLAAAAPGLRGALLAEDVTVAEVEDWAVGLEKLLGRVGDRFARSEPRARAGVYVRGLLSPAERKNGWTLAEQAGDATPDAMQRLLNHADWNADAVRDDLRDYVVEHLGDQRAVLVVDETGFLKKGSKSAGVPGSTPAPPGESRTARSGCSWPTPPRPDAPFWIGSCICRGPGSTTATGGSAAGIGDDVGFATKPELARRMFTRALDAGVPAGWLTAVEIYGQDKRLRVWCE